MRNKIFGAIGILWGGAIVANWLFSDSPGGSAAYNAGASGAVVLGALMFAAGLYYFVKKPRPSK